MPTPRKPVRLMKKHMDKETKEYRAEAEESLLSGECWHEYPEVKNNATAHRFFKRITELYSRIEKNDALTEPIINRYCTIQAECYDFEHKREVFSDNLDALIANDEMEDETKFSLEAKMQQSIINVDKQLMAKRNMLLNIEKETLMTLKAQLASIPKPEKEEPKKNKFTVIGNG
jgi:hypothetical protein